MTDRDTYQENTRDNTYSDYHGAVTGGGLLADGTYVFGGIVPTGKKVGEENLVIKKIFALRPSGEVVYLGFVEALKKSTSNHGNMIVSKTGDLYIADSSIITNSFDPSEPGKLALNVHKIDSASLQERLNNPVAKFVVPGNRPQNADWKTPSNQGFDHSRNGRRGSTGTQIPSTMVLELQPINTRNLTNFFAGFDLSPAGNYVVATSERFFNGQRNTDYTFVREYDKAGNIVSGINEYVNNHSILGAYSVNHGSNNISVTDMSGFLRPSPQRELIVKHQVTERADATDQFNFAAVSGTAINKTGSSTGNSTDVEEVIPKFTIPLNTGIELTETFNDVADSGSYKTTLTCVDTETNTTILGPIDGATGTVTVTTSGTKPIECTFVNTPKKYTLKFVKKLRDLDGSESFGVGTEFTLHSGTCNSANLANQISTKVADSQGRIAWDNLKKGEYCLKETKTLDGYKAVADSEVTLDDTTTTDSVLTLDDIFNPEIPAEFTIKKVDALNNELLLPGSEWQLQKFNKQSNAYETIIQKLTDDVTGQKNTNQNVDRDGSPGLIKVGNLQFGKYRLVETNAPTGYLLPGGNDKVHDFVLDKDNQSRTLVIQNQMPVEPPTLPLTGGWGTLPYLVSGLVLLTGATGVFLMPAAMRRRNPTK
ncbi:SpaA isopeptide-forming pilin-related protein [Boudabousia marimammalium]|uniref:SpaA isopeptide-forming pilin-related protein n=1 Tax=Boudabousia marimammalium TaxID=156892 RepID=UPI00117858EA|nr:SpaA isopeptide-forming pilin-related protein [Boudabousia marimammalium]